MKNLNKFKTFIIKTNLGFKNFLLNVCTTLLYKSFNSTPPQNILVFRSGFIGDAVCALPSMKAIRSNFPDAQISLLTKADEKIEAFLHQIFNPALVDKIINYKKIKSPILFRLLAKSKYDLFIELTQYDTTFWYQLRNIFIVRLLGIRTAFGWKVNNSTYFQHFQEKYYTFENERERLLNLLKKNKLQISNASTDYFVSNEITVKVKEVLRVQGLNNSAKNIGLVIGSKRKRNKWPIEYFKQVAEYYTAKSYNILILGAEEDSISAQKLIINKNVINFCGILSIAETAEIIKNCSCIISNDTGPMHLAYAVKTPLIALFSSRDFPNKWYPPNHTNIKVFRSDDTICSLCFTRECFDNVCLKKIKPQSVINATDNLLANINQ